MARRLNDSVKYNITDGESEMTLPAQEYDPITEMINGLKIHGAIETGTTDFGEQNTTLKTFYEIMLSRGYLTNSTAENTPNNIVLNSISPFTKIRAYKNGMRFAFLSTFANTSSCTINIDGIGAIDLKRYDSTTLEANDVLGLCEVVYNGSVFLLNKLFATTTNKGDLAIATQSEVNAGTDNTKAVTPLTLQTKLSSLISLGRIIVTRNTSNFKAVDFSSGRFDFSDGTGSAVLSAMTKLFTATWTQGTNAGILDTGTLQNNRWYKCFTIYNPTLNSTDVIATLDTNALPTLPSGWTKPTLHSVQYFDGTNLIPLDHVDKYKFNFLDDRGQFSEPTRNATFRPLCPAMKCEIECTFYQDTDDYYVWFANAINSKQIVCLQFGTGTAPENKGSSFTLYTNNSGNIRYHFISGAVYAWHLRYNSLTIYDNQN